MRVTHRITTLITMAAASALAATAPAAAAASATAGGHWISAQGHQSGRVALTVTANWAQFRYSHQHTGYNPNEHLLSPANVASLHQDWSSAAGESGTSPAVVNGVLYVTNPDGGVYAEWEMISLSRELPFGLRWIFKGFAEKLPKESVMNTLRGTKVAVASQTATRN